MDFDEMLNLIKSGEPESVPETIYDDLRNDYHTKLNGATATLNMRQEEIEKARAEITRLQAQNFQLLMSRPVDEDGDGGQVGEQDEPTESKPIYIDDLFRSQ